MADGGFADLQNLVHRVPTPLEPTYYIPRECTGTVVRRFRKSRYRSLETCLSKGTGSAQEREEREQEGAQGTQENASEDNEERIAKQSNY